MPNPIHDFLKKLRRTLAGKRYVPGRKAKEQPLVYTLLKTQDPLVGTLLGDKYQILERVGAGGMSVVYKAKQEPIGRIVAVKLLKREWTNDPLTVKRFRREARAVSSLRHPNVLLVMDIGTADGGQPYFICEFLNGKSLEEILLEQGSLPEARALPIFAQICDAMAHAHKNGLIHRDLKPGNIMLLNEPERKDFVKLVDFGIVKISDKAQAVSQKLTQKGEIWGSPTYMSPEQCMGTDLDGRSDIYSLGTVMYETLAGKAAFDGKTIPQIIVKQLNEMPAKFSASAPENKISPYLESIIFRALQKDASNRYQSMDEFKQALEDCIKNKGMLPAQLKSAMLKRPEVEAPPVEKAPLPKPTVSRHGSNQSPLVMVSIALGLLILLLAGYGVFNLTKHMLTPAFSVTVIKTERSDEKQEKIDETEKQPVKRPAPVSIEPAKKDPIVTTSPINRSVLEKPVATPVIKKKKPVTSAPRIHTTDIDESIYLRKRRPKNDTDQWHHFQNKEASP